MKKKFMEEQIAFALKQVEHGTHVAEVGSYFDCLSRLWISSYSCFSFDNTKSTKTRKENFPSFLKSYL